MRIPLEMDGIDINPRNPLGSYLKGLRMFNLMNTEDAADKYHITELTYINIERGKSVPRYSTLRYIANLYGLDYVKLGRLRRASYLINLEKKPPKAKWGQAPDYEETKFERKMYRIMRRKEKQKARAEAKKLQQE